MVTIQRLPEMIMSKTRYTTDLNPNQKKATENERADRTTLGK